MIARPTTHNRCVIIVFYEFLYTRSESGTAQLCCLILVSGDTNAVLKNLDEKFLPS